jgi:DNA-cytosine methyltransferase
MKVLSLFDGMSCGRIALDQLGIPVEKYYASEIDKYAMQVSAANYPDIEQVGDICDLDPKDYKDVNLMLAGSPCQGFSFAGKQLAFDDPRSALFFEFIRLLKAIKPKYFLLENVRMKKEFLQVISEQVSECYPEITFGIEPIFINSSLLSAQSRQRYYWTNIPGIKQPEDKGIVLRDILETEPESFTTMSDSFVARQKKNIDGKCLVDHNKEKAASLSAMEYVKNGRQGDYLACDEKGVPQDKPSEFDKNLDKMTNKEGKAHCLTASYTGAVAWNSIEKRQRTMVPTNKPIQVNPSKKAGGKQPYIQDRVFHEDGKSHSLTASFADRTNVATKPIKVGMNVEEVKVRKHEVDIESLQYVLREMKKESGKTNKQIAAETKMPVTKVEHWFRTDNSFAIPGDDIWHRLKEILGIKSEVFDKSIMEFEYRDGVFESTQRVYSDEGKSPTLTASNKEQMIETKPKQVGTAHHESGKPLPSWGGTNKVYGQHGKSPTIMAAAGMGGNREPKVETKPKQVGTAVDINGHDILKRVYSPDGKSPTVTTCGGGNREPKVITGGAIRGRAYDKDGKRMDKDGKSVANKTTQMLELRKDDKSNAITTVGKDSVAVKEDLTWRKLTCRECERLQTVPDDYTNHVSNTQRYKMLGNGWTIEVIKHIFKNMEHEVKDG